MTSSFLRPFSMESPPWTKPDRQLCAGVNAPATLFAAYPVRIADQWLRSYYPLDLAVEAIVYLSLIGLLWYAVSIEFEGRRLSVLTRTCQMRMVLDIAAVLFAGAVGAAGLFVSGQLGGNYGRLMSIPYLLWALVIAWFYGRDLWASRRG
jgi:hypothetical protein